MSQLPTWGTALNTAWMELWAQLLLADKFRAQPVLLIKDTNETQAPE